MKSLTIFSFLWKSYNLWWLPPGVCELCSLLAIFIKVRVIFNFRIQNWAATCDLQQCCTLTSVDSDEPVQPPFYLRNSKWCSVRSLPVIEHSSDQQRLWSDCAYAQADLSLCWSHIPHSWKSHVTAQMFVLAFTKSLLGYQQIAMTSHTLTLSMDAKLKVYIAAGNVHNDNQYSCANMTKKKKMKVRRTKTQISLGICTVWYKSSLFDQRLTRDPLIPHANSEDWSDWGDLRLLVTHMLWFNCLKQFILAFRQPSMLPVLNSTKWESLKTVLRN